MQNGLSILQKLQAELEKFKMPNNGSFCESL